jgi:hypothetical protein
MLLRQLMFSGIFLICGGLVQALYAAGPASFPHAQAKHRTLVCANCHTVTVRKPDVKEFPGHSACASCHDFSQEAISHYATFCAICHAGKSESAARPPLFAFPKTQVPTEFGVTFSHVSHLNALMKSMKVSNTSLSTQTKTQNCSECHVPVVPAKMAKPVIPDMGLGAAHSNCFRCHGEKPKHPPSMTQCAGCHILGGSMPPTLYGIVKNFRHSDHLYDIRPKKKADLAAGKKADLCSECHASVLASTNLNDIRLPAASNCVTCHSGKLGLPDALSAETLASLSKP